MAVRYIVNIFRACMNKWHWGMVGCWLLSTSVITTFLVRGSVKQTFFEGGSVVYKPRPDNINRPASISIVIKLVFHLRVTITIKGETQMGSVSNKDSIGY